MRSLTATALTEIAKQYGTEPINIVAIDWFGNDTFTYYADKDITDALGIIISISSVELALSVKTSQAFTSTIVLDDTDGSIKNILNTTNPQKRNCVIYQQFDGLASIDKFVLVKGVISGNLLWDEGKQTVTINIESIIEDTEVSVSLEETAIDIPSNTSSGKPWPLCFGKIVHVPATLLEQYPVAKIVEPFGLVDQYLYDQLVVLNKAYYQQQSIMGYWRLVLQGANVLQTATDLLPLYILLVKLEDLHQESLNGYRKSLAEARRLHKLKRWKNLAENQIIDAAPIFLTGMKDDADILKGIKADKMGLETQVNAAQYRKRLKTKASRNIASGYNGLANIYATYAETVNEICRQLKMAKTVIAVEDSEDFAQDTVLELIINSAKFRGSFSSNFLTLHSDALPRYDNLVLGPRQSVLDECGDIDELKGLDIFWLTSTSNLTNMYLLVRKIGSDKNHIIKVVEQEGSKYRFELKKYGDYNQQGQQSNNYVYSEETLQDYTGTFGIEPTPGQLDPGHRVALWSELSPSTKNLLGNSIPNNKELKFLIKLERIIPFEAALDAVGVIIPEPRDIFTLIGEDIESIVEASVFPLAHWFDGTVLLEEYPQRIEWKAKVNDTIKEATNSSDIFVSNILPSTVKAVYAYRVVDDYRSLHKLPTAYYTKNESEALLDANDNTVISITSIKVDPPLDEVKGEGWEKQIYVTLESSVGSGVTSILTHLINTYTDKSIDAVSFATVALDKYPANFAVLERSNILQLLNDIAWQSRCALYLNNDIFYLKYLATTPTKVKTLTESDILTESLKVTQDNLSDVITKITANWRANYLPEESKKIVLRHNVNKYGLHEEETNFFIYNNEDLVLKSATFWLIRKANLWKRVHFQTNIQNINLELFDTIELSFSLPYISSATTKAELTKLTYDLDSNILDVTAWLPIKAGEMTPYLFAWPADALGTDNFPTNIEITRGDAGGSGIGKNIVTKVIVG